MNKSELGVFGVVLVIVGMVVLIILAAVVQLFEDNWLAGLIILAVVIGVVIVAALHQDRQRKRAREELERQTQQAREELKQLADQYRADFESHPALFALLEPSLSISQSETPEILQGKMNQARSDAARALSLLGKYQDEQIVRRVFQQEIWQGETAEMVRDSLGVPVEVDEEVLKTKTKEIWKYKPIGRGQYSFRVILEQGKVVGWKDNQR